MSEQGDSSHPLCGHGPCEASPAPIQGEAHTAPRRRPGPPAREDISIAFKNSSYATPYGDSSIPGNHPGHRNRHLGRSYAPDPLTYSQLTHCLVAPFVEGVSPVGDVDCGDVNAILFKGNEAARRMGGVIGPRRTCFIGTENYILNVKNRGRRHFDETRGEEMRWEVRHRQLEPMIASCDAVRRKGLGVFNYDHNLIHPDAQEAMDQRERLLQRGQLGIACDIDRPRDHSMIELSMWHAMEGRKYEHPRRTTAPNGPNTHVNPDPAACSATQPSRHPAPPAESPAVASCSGGGAISPAKSSTVVGEAGSAPRMPPPTSLPPCPTASSRMGGGISCAEYHQSRQFLSDLKASKRSAVDSMRRKEDVLVVRNLPDW